MLCTQTFPSPLGPLALYANASDQLVGLFLPEARWPLAQRDAATVRETPVLARTAAQLAEYFAGTRRDFDLPLAGSGTAFQQIVWRGLVAIPYGETRSYGELARAIGNPTASRAVGAANGRNPISIVVPCHRVIGSSGELTGYGGGMDAKRWLLAHEARAFQLGWAEHFEAAR
jgi:methylated-DNA-[protein]-cysteine S-methyltransferase